MIKIISNSILRIFIGLIVGLCLLSTSNIAFAQGEDELDLEGPFEVELADGTIRQFMIHVPYNVDSSTPVPLMIDVHAYLVNPIRQAENTRWDLVAQNEAEAKDRFVTVYPAGTGWFGGTGIYGWAMSWNAGEGYRDDGNTYDYNGCCGNALFTYKSKDVEFIEKLVDYMKNETDPRYEINQTRIYGSGLSNGSALIQKILIERPKLFSAVYVSSQFLLEETDSNDKPSTPIFLSHGKADEAADYDGVQGASAGGNSYPSAQQNFERWGALLGCEYGPVKFTGPNDTDIQLFGTCRTPSGEIDQNNWPRVVLISIGNGDHVHYSNTDLGGMRVPEWAWSIIKNYPQETP